MRLAIAAASHQVWAYLFDVLGNETKPERAGRFNLWFLPETHRFKVVNYFTGAIHRFDLILETLRRDHLPSLPSEFT